MKRFLTLALFATLSMHAVGCGGGKALDASVQDVESRTAVTAEGDFERTVAEGNAAWEKRDSEEGTLEAIAAWEAATAFSTGERDRTEALFEVYTNIAHAYYWLGHGHKFFLSKRSERESAQKEAYEKCMEYASLALAVRNPAWNEALKAGTAIDEAVKLLTIEDVAPTYWYATCAGKWSTIEGISALLKNKDRIFELVSRVAELNVGFYYRASDRYFGVVYTKLPFMSPDLDRSRKHFQDSIEAYPYYMETRVLFVEELLTKTGEAELARQQLEYVVASDPAASHPEIYAENLRAQRHAKALLSKFDQYFL